MSLEFPDIDRSTLGLHALAQYEPIIGNKAADRIAAKAEQLGTLRVAHVSSTFYGGGVTEILTPLTLMMNAIGIETDWHLIQGTPAFFGCTKKLHNMLQGAEIDFPEVDREIYEQVVFENATRIHLEECDAVIVHDPQPLPLVRYVGERRMPWFWQCHVDLSSPHPATWNYLRPFVEQYDAAIFSLPEYGQNLGIDELFVTPAINPFSAKNVELSDREICDCLAQHGIPLDRPLVTQISLQRHAAVVLQKSTREGFGLTVTEAMWKGAAVIGGNVGGIRRQIVDGENGFLVGTVDQAAERIVQILKDPVLRRRIGHCATESVREKFLMSRLLEDWLDLLARYQRTD